MISSLAHSGSGTDLLCQIWDLRYGVLLTSLTQPIRASKAHPKEQSILLVPASHNQVLAVAPPSTVWSIPLTVPPASSIAAALGRAEFSRRWLLEEQHGDSLTLVSEPERDCLAAMRQALQRKGGVLGADNLLYELVTANQGKVR